MNYGQLKNNVRTLLNHDECTDELAAIFVQKAISRLQRTLRVPSMEAQAVLIAGTNTVGLEIPKEFLEEKELYVLGHPGILKKKTLDWILRHGEDVRGVPRVYAREGRILRLWPKPYPGEKIVLNYYEEFDPLVANTDTNWISVTAPDIVESCALAYAADHFIDERKASWESQWSTGAMELQAQAEMDALAGALVMSPAYHLQDGIE